LNRSPGRFARGFGFSGEGIFEVRGRGILAELLPAKSDKNERDQAGEKDASRFRRDEKPQRKRWDAANIPFFQAEWVRFASLASRVSEAFRRMGNWTNARPAFPSCLFKSS
jgi:hypothetical protein